jgi:hypothetical protein
MTARELILGWMPYYLEEPWDAPALLVRALVRDKGADYLEDPEAMSGVLRRATGAA